MSEITTITVSAPSDGFALFTDRSIVAMRVNGELRDLATILQDGDVVEAVGVDTPEGLAVLRHSTAHVLAQAVRGRAAAQVVQHQPHQHVAMPISIKSSRSRCSQRHLPNLKVT